MAPLDTDSKQAWWWRFFDFLGTPPFYIGVALCLAPWHLRTALAVIAATVAAELLCALIKLVTRFERPEPHPWPRNTLYAHYDASSFPSAHTARIAACMSVIYFAFGIHWLAVPAMVAIVGTACSRVVGRHHFVRDVLVGGLIGTALGYGAWSLLGAWQP